MSEVSVGGCGYTVTGSRPAAETVKSVQVSIAEEPHVMFHRDGPIGRIVLNRPKALNALTTAMVDQLHTILDDWDDHPGTALVLESSSPKAFCAGGDIRQIRRHTVDGAHSESARFFSREYRLNARLAESATPIVSVIDGVCMGGGLGLSVHGAFRVVTDNALLAMPETVIGFFPDVGASFFLSRLAGSLGTYLGMSGYRLDAADACYTGLATHRVADAAIVATTLAERADEPVDAVLRSISVESPEVGRLSESRAEIDWCFGAPTVGEIYSRLRESRSAFAERALEALQAVSRQSLDVTLATLMRGRQMGLRQCLDMELDIATHLIRTDDFVEGVRAGLVDKDRKPRWTSLQFAGFDSVGDSQWKDLF